MNEPDDGAWFAPKAYGYGAGRPIAWQGWVLVIALIGLSVVLAVALGRAHAGYGAAAVVGINLAVLPLIRARTRGGWRWRSGRK